MTTDIVRQWIEDAREQAVRDDRPVVVDTLVREYVEFPPYYPENHAPSGASLADVLGPQREVFVWPSGLVAGPDRVNWMWDFSEARRGPRFLLGFARQAEAYARRARVGVDEVWGVRAGDIHGTCVFVGGGEFGPWYGVDAEQAEHEEWNDWHHGRESRPMFRAEYKPYDWRMVQAVSFP